MLPKTFVRILFLLAVSLVLSGMCLSVAGCSSESGNTQGVEREQGGQHSQEIAKPKASTTKYDPKAIALQWIKAVQEKDFDTIATLTLPMQLNIEQLKKNSPQPFWKQKIDEYLNAERARFDQYKQWISFRRYVPKSSRIQVIDTREGGQGTHTIYVKVDYQDVNEAPVAGNQAKYPDYILQSAVLELLVIESGKLGGIKAHTVTYEILLAEGDDYRFSAPPKLYVDGMVYWAILPVRIGRVVAYTEGDWGKHQPVTEYPAWLRVDVVGGQGELAAFTGRIACGSSTSEYPRGSFISFIELEAPPSGGRGIRCRLDREKTVFPVTCTIDIKDAMGQDASAIIRIPKQPPLGGPGYGAKLCWEHPTNGSGDCPLF